MNDDEVNLNACHTRRLAAAGWVIRLHNAHADEDAVEEWLAWCQASPDNLATFENVRDLWGALGHPALMTTLISDLGERPSSDASLFSPMEAAPDLPQSVSKAAPRVWRSPQFARGLGSCSRTLINVAKQALVQSQHQFGGVKIAISVIALGMITLMITLHSRMEFTQTLSTAVASLSRQTLPDGSVVELGAKSKIRVRISQERRIIYVDDGEAFFRVAKDSARPFTVYAGDVDVVALGTQFNVRKAHENVVITVAEGTVNIESVANATGSNGSAVAHGGSSRLSTRAGAGRRVSYSSSKHSMTVVNFQAATPGSAEWAVGNLKFINEPLASVIEEANRYSLKRISLGDDELGKLIFTGTLRHDAVDDWLRGVRDVFGVDIVDAGGNGIVLTRRPKT